MRIGVLHGPNLNLLGEREPEIYGGDTLEEIDGRLTDLGKALGAEVVTYQSNGEGDLVTRIQELSGEVAGFLVNAAGYSHTSVAILDALRASGLPYVEVHLSNIATREPYRRRSLLTADAIGTVTGFGAASYRLALRGLLRHLRASEEGPGGSDG